MDGSRGTTQLDLRSIPVVVRRDASAKRGPLSRRAALFAGLLGPAITVASVAVEPAPADPASEPLVGTVIGLGLLATWVMAGAYACLKRPVALTWALAAAGVSLVMTLGCPLTGHHALGTWWFVQLGVSGASIVAAAALRSRQA